MTVLPNAQTEGHLRNFFQEGRVVGALPVNPYQFSGVNGQHFVIVNAQAPKRGRVTAIYSPDMRLAGGVIREGQTIAPPSAPVATVRFTRGGGVPRQLYSLGMNRVTFYQSAGECRDPSNFDTGWEDYLLVYANGIASGEPLGGQSGFEGNSLIVDSLDFTFDRIYPVGQLQKTRTLTAEVRLMVAATYARTNSRNIRALGNEVAYVLTTNTSTNQPYIYYTTNAGITWTPRTLINWDGEGVTDVEAVQGYVIITSEQGYYLASINVATGLPDLTLAPLVTRGWTGGYYPQSVFALDSNTVFFASQDKRVYVARRVEGGVQVATDDDSAAYDMQRVHGNRHTVVAVGTSDVVIYSQDKGVTWRDSGSFPDIGTIRGVHVLSPYVWWVCGDGGGAATLAYTVDGGRIWTNATLDVPPGVTLTQGFDVRFVNDECGYYVAVGSDGNTYVFATMNGGFTWAPSANRIRDPFDTVVATRIAVPEGVDPAVAANSAIVIGNIGSTGYVYAMQAPIR